MAQLTLTFAQIAVHAGFKPGPDGKFNLPAEQNTADALALAAAALVGEWKPGDPQLHITLTGMGPVWGHLAIAHSLHGRCVKLTYAAPNAPEIVIWRHGA